MTLFATLNGQAVSALSLSVPAEGLWHADVSLSEDFDPSGPQTLLLSGSTWVGAVVRSIAFAGQRQVRIVAGQGGWRGSVPAQQYKSELGVPTVTVLSDAASLVGETPPVLDASAPSNVGNYFVRQAGAAALVLWDLVAAKAIATWWSDASGIIQTMARPAGTVSSPFVAEEVRGAIGWYRIATESPGDWLPGASFSGPTVSGTIARVEHRISRGRFWSEVLV